MKKNISILFKFIFFLSIGLFFIWLFLHNISADDKKKITNSILEANYYWVIISIFIGLLSHIIRTLRWQLLLEPLDYKSSFKNTFFAVMIGYFANLALPRLGEITRCGILKKYDNIPIANSLGTVITERAFDLVTFIILFFLNILIQFKLLNNYVNEKILLPISVKLRFINNNYIFILSSFLLLVIIIIFLNKILKHNKFYIKIKDILQSFWQGLKSISQIKKPYLFILYTFLIWLAYFFTTYVCIFAIKETTELNALAVFSILIFGTIGIMLVQGGIGIYPAIVAEILILYNVNSVYGYALGWLTWSAQTLTIIIFGILSLIMLSISNKKNTKYVKT